MKLWQRQRRREADRQGLPRLWLAGDLEHGELALGHAELASLPREQQIEEVGAYASGLHGRGVRLAALVDRALPKPAARYVNLSADGGRFRASFFRTAVEDLAIVLYERDGRPLAREEGGPFRLVLPGSRDACREIGALEEIRLEREPGPDVRRHPRVQGELPPIAGASYPPGWVEPETSRPRTYVVPPRFEGEPRIPSPRGGGAR